MEMVVQYAHKNASVVQQNKTKLCNNLFNLFFIFARYVHFICPRSNTILVIFKRKNLALFFIRKSLYLDEQFL